MNGKKLLDLYEKGVIKAFKAAFIPIDKAISPIDQAICSFMSRKTAIKVDDN